MEREQFIARPDASDAFRTGWEALKKYFLEFLLVTLIVGALASLGSLFSRGGGFGSAGISMLLGLLVSGPLSFGAAFFYLKAMRGDDFEIRDIFSPFRENYLQVVLAYFLYASIVMIGFFLLIIPGIIMAIRLSFVPYLVMDEKLEPIEAIKASWEMTKDFSGKIFLFGIMAIGVALLGLVCLIIGIIPAAMLIQASFASLYLGIRGEFEEMEVPVDDEPLPEDEPLDMP